MIENKYIKLRKNNVSRETCVMLEEYIHNIVEKNNKINLISKKSEKFIRERHIIDCAQAIDFIDEKDKKCIDIGSGAGLPGIVLAILLKGKKSDMEFVLYEKSYHKAKFLREVSGKLSLKTRVIEKNVFEEKNILADTVISRAFKPLPELLELVSNNFKKIKNLVVFMGANGEKILDSSKIKWKFSFEKKLSVTNENSFILNIKNLKRVQ